MLCFRAFEDSKQVRVELDIWSYNYYNRPVGLLKMTEKFVWKGDIKNVKS